MKGIITVVTVMVFLGILFRKKLLPFFRGRKQLLPEKAVVPSALPEDYHAHIQYDVLVFDTACYESCVDMGEHISLQLTRKMQYVELKGSLLSLKYVAAGTFFFAIIGWTEG